MVTIPNTAANVARREFRGLLVDRCAVSRGAVTQDDAGATKKATPAPVTGLEAVPCRIEFLEQEPMDRPGMADGMRFRDATHSVFFAHDAAIEEGDRLTIARTGGVLEVLGLGDQQSQPFTLQAIAKELG